MSEFQSHMEISGSSNQSFGRIMSVALFILAALLWSSNLNLSTTFSGVAILFLCLSCVAPNLLSLPNKLWTKFGLLLGKITTPIILGIIYVFVLLPTAMLLRVFKKDLLDMTWHNQRDSYWKIRDTKPTSMKEQF